MRYIGDYRLEEKLHENHRANVYKGVRKKDELPIIVKVVSTFNKKALKHLYNEHRILQKYNFKHVIAILDFDKNDDYEFIVYEDIQGQSLDQILLASPLDLNCFFEIAISIIQALEEIHNLDIMHCDIKPSNIIVNRENQVVKLTDFGIASEFLYGKKANMRNIQGSIPYISPERTGWTDQVSDYRSDYYSLGATFYEMLTGSLPFTEKDIDRLIHAHIAQIPKSPSLLNEKIPTALSEFVLKLLQKNPQERYLNAASIVHDLKIVKNSLYEDDMHSFVSAKAEPTFEISTKVYGRDKEIKILRENFSQFIKQNRPFLNVIYGSMGSGKTTVVKKCYPNFFQHDIFFAHVKCENVDKPYAAVAKLATELIFFILTQETHVVEEWQKKLGRFPVGWLHEIIQFVPDLENLVDLSSTPFSFSGLMELVWIEFLLLFTDDKPVVCFIDDLQWIDESSLSWMISALNQQTNIFFVCTSRNRAIENKIQHLQNVAISEISLDSLEYKYIEEWIQDSLFESLEDAGPLIQLIKQKTEGNALCVKEFLQMLHQCKFLYYEKKWCYDFEKIPRINDGNYSISYTMTRIDAFSSKITKTLEWMCCIGNEFDQDILSDLATEQSSAEIAETISYLLKENIILQYETSLQSNIYRFAHDSIRETLYENMEPQMQINYHYCIGIYLHEHSKASFDIVKHLNIALDKVKQNHKQDICIDCNIKASESATKANSYPLAIELLHLADTLVKGNENIYNHFLFSIRILLGECEFLRGNISLAEEYFAKLGNMDLTTPQQLKIYKLKLLLYSNIGEYKLGVDSGLQALQILGRKIPYQLSKTKLAIQILKNLCCFSQKSTKMPEVIQEKMSIFKDLTIVVFMCQNPKLFLYILLEQMRIAKQYGPNSFTAQAYIFKAWLYICMKKYDLAYKIACEALNLCKKYYDPLVSCRVKYFYVSSIYHWKNHLDVDNPYLEQQIQEAQYVKDHTMFSYGVTQLILHYLYSGENLEKTELIFEKILVLSSKNKRLDDCHNLLLALYQLKKIICGRSRYNNWTVESFDKEFTDGIEDSVFAIYCTQKVELLYIFHHHKAAYDYIQKILRLVPYSHILASGTQFSWYFTLYYSLVVISLYKTQQKKQPFRRLFHKFKKALKRWTQSCPKNFQHIYTLICAEEARVLHKPFQAMQFYDVSIRHARKNGFTHHEAIANEKAGEFYLEMGKEQIAETYIRAAYRCYREWGGHGKVSALRDQYPQWLNVTPQWLNVTQEKFSNDFITLTTTIARDKLDLQTILKTGILLSSELNLDLLVQKWLTIAVESTGAAKGILFGGDNLQVLGQYRNNEIDSPQNKFSNSVVNYVQQTQEKFVTGDASTENKLNHDNYICKNSIKSIMCLPLVHQQKLIAILYLENNLVRNVFSKNAIIEFLAVQAAIAIENATLYQRLSEQMFERQKLQQQVLQISDDEKQRLGQDLHDDLGQYATAMQLCSRTLHNRLYKIQSPLVSDTEELIALAKEMSGRISHMARGLYPVNINNKSLRHVLENLLENSQKFLRLNCHMNYDSKVTISNPIVVKHLYMITQEAIHNAKKHAQATNVWIDVSTNNNSGTIKIRNDGSSFQEKSTQGLGLFTMNNRAQIIEGNLTIKKEQQTSIVCNFPHSSHDESTLPDF